MRDMFLAAWRYRQFILSSIRSEFQTRFARSRLGGLWMIIHPLAQAAIFALILAELMSAKLPGMTNDKFAYAVYLLSGTMAWSLFSEVVSRSVTLFIDNANLLKKIVFPRICLPLIVAGSALFNNLLLFVAIIVVFSLLGHIPGVHVLWIPFLMVTTLIVGLSIGLILGVFNVFVRDVGQVVPVVLQLAFWFTPIVYTPNIVPDAFRPLLAFNPMTAIVQSYQGAILFDTPPDLLSIAGLGLVTLPLLLLALVIFRRASPEMVDVL